MHDNPELLRKKLIPITYNELTPRTPYSRVCEGTYPPGTSQDEIEKLVSGPFGGRFEQFGGGRFRYIAYTD